MVTAAGEVVMMEAGARDHAACGGTKRKAAEQRRWSTMSLSVGAVGAWPFDFDERLQRGCSESVSSAISAVRVRPPLEQPVRHRAIY